MRVMYKGPDEWGARQVARHFAQFRQERYVPGPDIEAPSLDYTEPLTFVPERIPETDPDFPEFRWRCVAYSDLELAEQAHG